MSGLVVLFLFSDWSFSDWLNETNEFVTFLQVFCLLFTFQDEKTAPYLAFILIFTSLGYLSNSCLFQKCRARLFL